MFLYNYCSKILKKNGLLNYNSYTTVRSAISSMKAVSLIDFLILPSYHRHPRRLPLAFLPSSFEGRPNPLALLEAWTPVVGERIRIVRVAFRRTLAMPVQQSLGRAFVPLCEQSVRMDAGPNTRQTRPFGFVSESVPGKAREYNGKTIGIKQRVIYRLNHTKYPRTCRRAFPRV